MKLAAAQILSSNACIMQGLANDPVNRNEHFKKYNINAATFDEAYTRANGEEYLGYLEAQVREAANRQVDLLLFPEFCFQPGVTAGVHPTIPLNPNARTDALRVFTWSGKLFTQWLRRQAKQTGMLIGAASFTVRGGKIYNTGLLADEQGELALRYEKIHLPFDEKQTVEFGRKYTVADTRLGKVGFAICYDMQYPEDIACLAMQGVQIILHPSGGYTGPGEPTDMGQQRLRVRAADAHAALVYACFAKDNTGCRESCVIAPNGELKACVTGTDIGFAVGEVEFGAKQPIPGAPAETPDWIALRRAHRRPQTYRPLIAL